MKRMKSDQVRVGWRDVLDEVQAGETVIVERYNRPVARILPEDDRVVVLRVADANQAARLRQLVQEHGAVGIPFPNNTTPGLRVVNEAGDPVDPHSIPSVAAEVEEATTRS